MYGVCSVYSLHTHKPVHNISIWVLMLISDCCRSLTPPSSNSIRTPRKPEDRSLPGHVRLSLSLNDNNQHPSGRRRRTRAAAMWELDQLTFT